MGIEDERLIGIAKTRTDSGLNSCVLARTQTAQLDRTQGAGFMRAGARGIRVTCIPAPAFGAAQQRLRGYNTGRICALQAAREWRGEEIFAGKYCTITALAGWFVMAANAFAEDCQSAPHSATAIFLIH